MSQRQSWITAAIWRIIQIFGEPVIDRITQRTGISCRSGVAVVYQWFTGSLLTSSVVVLGNDSKTYANLYIIDSNSAYVSVESPQEVYWLWILRIFWLRFRSYSELLLAYLLRRGDQYYWYCRRFIAILILFATNQTIKRINGLTSNTDRASEPMRGRHSRWRKRAFREQTVSRSRDSRIHIGDDEG